MLGGFTVKTIEELLAKIEELGWATSIDEKGYVNISVYSPEGQDVQFVINSENNAEKLITELLETANNYDPDEEASYWIGSDGHGKNGAPYRLIDLIKDMEWVDEEINKLARLLSRYYYEIDAEELNNTSNVESDADDENKMVTLSVRVWCQASYLSSIKVPANLSKEEALDYVKEHMYRIPLGKLEYLPDSDEIDEESFFDSNE
jgi:hypothetical protein